jgi:hypothetical protein
VLARSHHRPDLLFAFLCRSISVAKIATSGLKCEKLENRAGDDERRRQDRHDGEVSATRLTPD